MFRARAWSGLLLVATLVALNRSRGPLERHALADGLIVSLGAGLVSSVLFIVPALYRRFGAHSEPDLSVVFDEPTVDLTRLEGSELTTS